MRQQWTSRHRDDAVRRVNRLTTAATGVALVGSLALGASMVVASSENLAGANASTDSPHSSSDSSVKVNAPSSGSSSNGSTSGGQPKGSGGTYQYQVVVPAPPHSKSGGS